MANLYVYRTELAECQQLGAPTLFVDGHPIYNLVEDAYTVVALSEGTHKLKVHWGVESCPDLEFFFSVEARQTRFLKFTDTLRPGQDRFGGFGQVGHVMAAELPQNVAEGELSYCCRYLPADKLPATSRP
jgi:hypothetical protein